MRQQRGNMDTVEGSEKIGSALYRHHRIPGQHRGRLAEFMDVIRKFCGWCERGPGSAEALRPTIGRGEETQGHSGREIAPRIRLSADNRFPGCYFPISDFCHRERPSSVARFGDISLSA